MEKLDLRKLGINDRDEFLTQQEELYPMSTSFDDDFEEDSDEDKQIEEELKQIEREKEQEIQRESYTPLTVQQAKERPVSSELDYANAFLQNQKEIKKRLGENVPDREIIEQHDRNVKNYGRNVPELQRMLGDYKALNETIGSFPDQKKKEQNFIEGLSDKKKAEEEERRNRFEALKQGYVSLNPFQSKEDREIAATKEAMETLKRFENRENQIEEVNQEDLIKRQKEIDALNSQLRAQGLPLIKDVIQKTSTLPAREAPEYYAPKSTQLSASFRKDLPYSSVEPTSKQQPEKDLLSKIYPYRNAAEEFYKEESKKTPEQVQKEKTREPAQALEFAAPPKELSNVVDTVLKELGLENDPLITKEHVLRTAFKESGYDQNKIGTSNDVGTMQTTPPMYEDIKRIYPKDVTWSFDDLKNDVYKNVKSSVMYMKALRDKYGAATPYELSGMYNGGPEAFNIDKKPKEAVNRALSYADSMYPSYAQRSPSEEKISPQGESIAKFLTAGKDVRDLGGEGPLMGGPYAPTSEGRDLYAKLQREHGGLLKAKEEFEKRKTSLPEAVADASQQLAANVPEEKTQSKEEVKGLIGELAKDKTGLSLQVLKALRDKNENIFNANLLRSVNMITTALSGMGSKVVAKNESDKFFEDLLKQAGSPIEDLTTEIAFKKQGIELEKDDPNSPASKQLQKVAQKMLGASGILGDDGKPLNVENLSFNQLEKIMGNLSTYGYQVAKSKADTTEKEAKLTEEKSKEQRTFLNQEARSFQKSKEHENLVEMMNAKNIISAHLKARREGKPDTVVAQQLKYLFAKMSDPRTGVKEKELQILGLSGGILRRMYNNIKQIQNGDVSLETLNEFDRMADVNLKSRVDILKKNLGSIIERGKDYGLNEKDIISKVAGPDYYKSLYTSEGYIPLTNEEKLNKGIDAVMKTYNLSREEAQKVIANDPRLQEWYKNTFFGK